MKIIVADDDPVARLFLEATITGLGHQVVSCPDGNAAWDAITKGEARIILSDWMMPGMDGLELCRRVRGTNQPIYFILVSSTVDSPAREKQAAAAGVDDMILKPALPEVICEHVRHAEHLCVA